MKSFQLKRSWLKKEASPYTGKVNHVDMNLRCVLLMDLICLTTLFLGHRINFSCFLKTNIAVNNRPLKEKKIIINKLFQTSFYQLRYESLSQTTETLVIFSLLLIKSTYLVLLYL